MRHLKSGIFAAVVAMIFHASNAASQAAPQFIESTSSWQRCLADKIKPRVQSSDSAETLANFALAQCKSAEAHAIAIGEKYHGAEGRKAVLSYKSEFRTSLPRMLSDARSGRASSDPTTRWSQCVVATATDGAAKTDLAADLIADKSFAACQSFEKPVRAAYAQGANPQESEKSFAIVRRTMRSQVIEAINAARVKKQ